MRKLAFSLCLLLSLSLCLSLLASAAYMPDENKDFKTNSQAVYLYNTDTGTVIYQKNEQMKLQPASTAKIMTAVLALENTDDLDEEFTYPSYIFNMLEPGVSQADVRVGETMTMRKALYALMLQSDCFSALAIADRIGDGDIDAFIQMMNDKAKELGAVNTNFANPHGLYDENNYTTAYDLFLITKYAVDVDGFMEIASTPVKDIGPTNIHSEGYNMITTILPMIKSSEYYYEPIRGIKTGTLDEVGRNYVSMASKNGYTYILVLLGAPIYDSSSTGEDGSPVPLAQNTVFQDAINIYEWAFNGFESKMLLEKGKSAGEVKVRLSKDADHVALLASEDFSALVPSEYASGVVLQPHIPETVDAPVKRGDKIGTVDIVLATEVLGTVDLLAEADISRSQTLYILDYIKGLFKSFWVKFAVILVILIIALYITLMVLRNRYRKRYRRAHRHRG